MPLALPTMVSASPGPFQPRERCGFEARDYTVHPVLWWMGILLLAWSLSLSAQAWGGEARGAAKPAGQENDPCWRLLRQNATQLRQLLDLRLRRDFPVEAQLDEGHARLSPLSIVEVDCEHQRVVVSGAYEFRGNIGVMDVTRRGTAVIQLRLTPRLEQRQMVLEDPKVVDLTFDNPAPWFDGKAITNWVLTLFARPTCVTSPSGLPC
jgi:hypothetical protein